MTNHIVHLTIGTEGKSFLKEGNSKFHGLTFWVKDLNDVKSKIDFCKSEYPSASHYCFAYVIDKAGAIYRANDDGEPSNSAGQPIYRQILSHNLTGVLVVVVRYYGGKKLGVPGLISSYGECARMAIEDSEIVGVEEEFQISIRDVHKNDHLIYSFVKRYKGKIAIQPALPGSTFGLIFPLNAKEDLQNILKELPNFDWKEGLPQT
jgi:putative IMPACT (imprinted ancient) family translation regulator